MWQKYSHRKVIVINFWSTSLPVFADGPLSVHISGPDSAHMGSVVTLACSADSRPDCDFYWYINSHVFIIKTGPVLTFPATKSHTGNYTCVARNPVTDVTLHQSKLFVGEWAASLLQYQKSMLDFSGDVSPKWPKFYFSFTFRKRFCAASPVSWNFVVVEFVCFQPHCTLQLRRPVSLCLSSTVSTFSLHDYDII